MMSLNCDHLRASLDHESRSPPCELAHSRNDFLRTVSGAARDHPFEIVPDGWCLSMSGMGQKPGSLAYAGLAASLETDTPGFKGSMPPVSALVPGTYPALSASAPFRPYHLADHSA